MVLKKYFQKKERASWIVFVCIALLILFVGVEGGMLFFKKDDLSKGVASVVHEIKISSKEGELLLKKVNGRWMYGDYNVDKEKLNFLLDGFSGLTKEYFNHERSLVTGDESMYSKYGVLEGLATKLELFGTRNKLLYRLYVGGIDIGNQDTFIRVNEDTQIYRTGFPFWRYATVSKKFWSESGLVDEKLDVKADRVEIIYEKEKKNFIFSKNKVWMYNNQKLNSELLYNLRYIFLGLYHLNFDDILIQKDLEKLESPFQSELKYTLLIEEGGEIFVIKIASNKNKYYGYNSKLNKKDYVYVLSPFMYEKLDSAFLRLFEILK